MRLGCWKTVSKAILLPLLGALPVVAQSVRVEIGKYASAIPKICESVTPASIPTSDDDPINVAALVQEATCKGAGDMLSDYTYEVNSSMREKGNPREKTTTYEVFIATLKGGSQTRGILVVTSRNGTPVPSDELEKKRLQAAELLEREEEKIARDNPDNASPSETTSTGVKGMLPLGVYHRTRIARAEFGVDRGGAVLAVQTFLRTCELRLARRERNDGRDTLVFNFIPRQDAYFNWNEKYVSQLYGEIWIDAKDRIVTRIIGWPTRSRVTDNGNAQAAGERPPAVYFEMMRVRDGSWLPRVTRINGADYPTLFDRFTHDAISTYSRYIRFSTEVKDVKMDPPKKRPE